MNKLTSIVRLILVFLIFTVETSGQELINKQSDTAEHKIVFQLTSSDTVNHKQLIKQLNNILKISPTSKIEVVCHGLGIEFLMSEKSKLENKILELSKKGIDFKACEFTMKEKKIDKEKLFLFTETVPAGIIEIVSKQEKGWSYIKAGN